MAFLISVTNFDSRIGQATRLSKSVTQQRHFFMVPLLSRPESLVPKETGESQMKSIATIEGIGPGYAEKLKLKGIDSVESLLKKGGNKAGRRELAASTGISETMLLKWVNMADLFRINGVAGQYAELLERAGVDTVKELAQRNADSLHQKMTEVNQTAQVVRLVPGIGSVEKWVMQAKTLAPMVSH
jgi:predicted flap endonuclease-1-like 5' DNA nuclease